MTQRLRSVRAFSVVNGWIGLASLALGAFALGASGAAARQASDAATMKAVRLHEYGPASALRYEDAPKPAPGAKDLLVRVHAAGTNPVDWKIRGGMMPLPKEAMPIILGYDVAGVVEAVGAEVKGFKPGDEVFAYLSLQRGGGYAEYTIVRESEAAMKPKNADFVHAAAVPLAALTAWQAMFDTAGLKEGQTVLIHGGAGGVGHFAVQLAKARGAKVIATASEKNVAFVRSLGADTVIDYKAQKFEDVANDVDVVLDPIGGETQERSFGVLKPGGFLVSIVQPPAPEKLKEKGVRGAVILVKPNGGELAEIAALIDTGKVKPEVSETLPLAEGAKAQTLNESGAVSKGKIVLKVR